MIESPAIAARNLAFRFGSKQVLDDVSLQVPRGAFYALLGPNGAGKTTLMQILMGIHRNYKGSASVLGQECARLRVEDRQRIGYVAEGLKLPGWMRVEQLEAYLAPLYPTWDFAHARDLRERFEIDPETKISKLSRGNYMKTALLCALAPRPELLILDEPFTGMDVGVKDELVAGLLTASGADRCTILLSSHDIGELELLADWVGFLDGSTLKLSEPVEEVRSRFKHVDVLFNSDVRLPADIQHEWASVELTGRHLRFVSTKSLRSVDEEIALAGFPSALRTEVREASLKEVFLAMRSTRSQASQDTSDRFHSPAVRQ